MIRARRTGRSIALSAALWLGLAAMPQPVLAGARTLPIESVRDAEAADLAETRSSLVELQVDDTRLLSIGWQLASANAAFCTENSVCSSLQLPMIIATFAEIEAYLRQISAPFGPLDPWAAMRAAVSGRRSGVPWP